MAIDLKLYNSVGNFVTKASEELGLSAILDSPASGMEVLACKVVKFLLTSKGTDAFNPYYGGTAMQRKQIDIKNQTEFRLELLEDIRRCGAFIKDAETTTTEYPLENIILNKISYYEEDGIAALNVFITITSTTGDTMSIVLKD